MRKIWFLAPVVILGCAKADVNNTPTGGTSSGGTGGKGGSPMVSFGGQAGTVFLPGPMACAGDKCTDFPAAPLLDTGVPANAAEMFSGTPAGSGPCVMEPEDGTLFPRNWLRPRVRWTGASGLAQIKVTSPHQANELVAYTSGGSFTIPKAVWSGLGAHALATEDFTVTVRIAGGGATSVKFRIAPVEASGSMVFWAANPAEVGKDPTAAGVENDSELRGFAVGDESTISTLKIPQVEQPSKEQSGTARKVKCIGCHAATPDGQYVAFVDHWPWNTAIAGVKPGIVGKPLPNMGAGGLSAMNQPWGGMPTFSKAHWLPGDRIMVLNSALGDPMQPWITTNNKPAKLVWYDLDSAEPPLVNGQKFPVFGQQFGEIARTGDAGGAACPSWSHDGSRIVYSSTQGGNLDGRLEMGKTDLYLVPYNDRKGGAATPVSGGADPAFEEYYPSFSPDDKLIAFNRVPAGQKMYANKNAELFVVPTDNGGVPVRLKANDPPACSGKTSPGINNHWGRWSPQIQPAGNGTTYYWIIFSSNRSGIPPVMTKYPKANNPLVEVSQLYVTAVVQTENEILTYPAIYLWNQPTTTLNTTPAWEAFELPPVE